MKKVIAITLLATLYGCNSENTDIEPTQTLSLPGGATVPADKNVIRDEILVVNGKEIRKVSIKIPETNAILAEKDFYKTLEKDKYNRRVTDTGNNSIRVFYSSNNEPGIDSYFVGPVEQTTATGEVRLVLAWPTKQ